MSPDTRACIIPYLLWNLNRKINLNKQKYNFIKLFFLMSFTTCDDVIYTDHMPCYVRHVTWLKSKNEVTKMQQMLDIAVNLWKKMIMLHVNTNHSYWSLITYCIIIYRMKISRICYNWCHIICKFYFVLYSLWNFFFPIFQCVHLALTVR